MSLFRFPPFTFDSRSGILTRNGRYLPVPKQTALLLAILLDRAGDVVTRTEIQEHLWPEGDHLDHEHAINRTVNNLRMVLRDNGKKTRYVETVPKRGYYFAAPVEIAPEASQAEPATIQPPAALGTTDSGTTDFDTTGFGTTGSNATGPAEVSLELVSAQIEATPPLATSVPNRHTTQAKIPARTRSRSILLWAAAALILLLTAAAVTYFLRHRQPPAATHAIILGVAPFETEDADAERLGESLRLDLMDALSQLPAVQLRASHSLDTLKRDDGSIREVSRLLKLDYMLIGRMHMQDKRCLLDFELIRGADAVHVASYQYSGTEQELAGIRDRIQRDLFRTIAVQGKSVQAVKGSTENPKAYADYLNARDLAYQRTGSALKKSLALYQTAIQEDPGFAQAYAGMATAYVADYPYTNLIGEIDAAKAAANKALELDPDLSEAHAILGVVAYRTDRNFPLAEQQLRLAVEHEPHEAKYHAWLADLFVIQGRFDEALAEIDIAHADDPLWPQLFNIEITVAGAARDYPRAIRAANRYLEMVPDSSNAIDALAWAYFGEKRFEDAIAQWRQMALLDKDPVRLKLEDRGLETFRRGGIEAYGRLRLETIAKAEKGEGSDTLALRAAIDRHSNDFSPAEWHAYLGDRDQAIAGLRKIVAARNGDPLDLAVNAMYDNLHQDPEFLDMLVQVGLKLPAHYVGHVKAQ